MIHQLTVKLPDRPGTLAGMVSALAEAGVDIKALGVSDRGDDHGEASLLVTDLAKAQAALTGHEVRVVPVIAVEMDDQVGGLAAILSALAKSEVNIAQLYAFVGRHQSKALAVIRSDAPERAVEVLTQAGFKLLDRAKIETPDQPPEGPTPLSEHLGLDFIW
jgi:hypothetical protein